jgi:acetate kinase
MYILVINCGSSSIKFTLFKKQNFTAVINGIVERIGEPGTTIHFRKINGKRLRWQIQLDRIPDAIDHIARQLRDPELGGIDAQQITAIGHRVVHGGETMHKPRLVDDRVKQVIRSCFDLAPLHNPPNLNGIIACEMLFPWAQQVAVFDTAFHATLPPHAFLYALPYDFYQKKKIRKYGFHGTSHMYVSRMAAQKLGKPVASLCLITCHLGNGSSITAISQGISIDTSMGFTPLEGVPMGTRCGDIDPAVVFYLMRKEGMDVKQIEALLIRESGLRGLSGLGSSDMRDLEAAAKAGNHQAEIAIQVFAYRVKKYIGAYAFAMGGLDAVVFTAGIGENSAWVRQLICDGLEPMGIVLDRERNASVMENKGEIHSAVSDVRLLIIPTDEESEIAHQTAQAVDGHNDLIKPDKAKRRCNPRKAQYTATLPSDPRHGGGR